MIETKRCLLRKFKKSDYRSLFMLDSNPEVHKYLYNNPINTFQDSSAYIEKLLNDYQNHDIGRLHVSDKKTNEFIGWAGLKYNTLKLNGKTNYFDIGYRILPKFWNKGFATELSLGIIDYYYDNFDLIKNIVGITRHDNVASIRVLEKSGLIFCNDFFHNNIKLKWFEFT